MSLSDLANQQYWLMDMMLNGNKLDMNANPYVQDSEHFPAASRLFVYQQGYRLRLLECMQAEFPVLNLYLGEELFALFVLGYLQQRPSTHYSLYELGAYFADFLARTRPAPQQMPDKIADYLTLPQQLAEVERARSCALRNTGCEAFNRHPSITEMVPLSWPSITLPDTSFIVNVEFDLFNYVLAADNYLAENTATSLVVEKPNKPAACQQSLLIYRHRYRVCITLLEPWQSVVLTALQTAQHTKQHVKSQLDNTFWQQVAKQAQLSPSELLAALNSWLPTALLNSQVYQEKIKPE